jgi:hypothetical protein
LHKQKNKKNYFWDKSATFLIAQTNNNKKRTPPKKNPKTTTTKKNPHTFDTYIFGTDYTILLSVNPLSFWFI